MSVNPLKVTKASAYHHLVLKTLENTFHEGFNEDFVSKFWTILLHEKEARHTASRQLIVHLRRRYRE